MKFGVATYDPPKSKAYKTKLRQEYVKKYGRKRLPENTPLEAKISVFRPIQKSLSKKEYALRVINKVLPIVKPDVDNYIKIALDGLNGLAFKDDNQITDIYARKRYSDEPRLEIEIKEIDLDEI